MGFSAKQLQALKRQPSRCHIRIAAETTGITADTALRLGKGLRHLRATIAESPEPL
jgi:plasmid maintenance system antidote protein VapI